jgi:ribosome-binding factor A
MPKDYARGRRIEAELLRTLAELVRREVKDPRVGPVTLTAVEVSPDVSHATVYFLPFDASRPVEEVGAALASAAPFLRHELRSRIRIRFVPELHFKPDESIERAAKLSALIASAVKQDAERHVGDPPGGPGASSSGENEEP